MAGCFVAEYSTGMSNVPTFPAPGAAPAEESVTGQRVHGVRPPHPKTGSRSHEVARAGRHEAGMEALLCAHLLAFVGRPREAFDQLHDAIVAARAAGDESLLLTLQLARLRIFEAQGQDAAAVALRQEIILAAERRGFLMVLVSGATATGIPVPAPDGREATALSHESEAGASMQPPHGPPHAPAGAAPGMEVPVQIRTFGEFSVLVRGRPLSSGRKVQHKPLALLQAIIARGGSNVSASLLVDSLWPDADGACGRRALDVALLRLRRLLRVDDAIVVWGGKLSLNRDLCWVDTWAFETVVEHAEQATSYLTLERARRLAARMVELYRGRFLGPEEDRPWTLQARDRLSAKFVRGLTLCARALAEYGVHAEAEALYRRGLELDNLSEALYRGLMECCAAQGHCSEALTVYRRCRDLLSIVLNTRPSPDTEALHRGLNGG